MSGSNNSRNGFLNLNSNPEQSLSFGKHLGPSFGDNQYFQKSAAGSMDQYQQSYDLALNYSNYGEIPQQLFRNSPNEDYELQYEDIPMEKLHIEASRKQYDDQKRSFDDSKSGGQNSGSYDNIKIENGDHINILFKPDINKNATHIKDIKVANLAEPEGKSIYDNKIKQLVEKIPIQNVVVQTKSPRQSKSQQKYERKSSNNMRDVSDISSNDNHYRDNSQDPTQCKLAKNRESAKNSRNRKKVYYDLLEAKVKELETEIIGLKEQLRNFTKSSETQTKNHERFKVFLQTQQQLFDKLETTLISQKDNSEIGMILDALKYRTNSNAVERIETALSYIEASIEVCLPIQTKYLFHALENNLDFFANNAFDYTEWMREIFLKTDIRQDSISNITRIKQRLSTHKANMNQSIINIKAQLDIIQNEAIKVDSLWESVNKCLTPAQLGSCILAMRQNSFRKELQTLVIFPCLKNQNMIEEDEEFKIHVEEVNPSVSPRKLVKTGYQ